MNNRRIWYQHQWRKEGDTISRIVGWWIFKKEQLGQILFIGYDCAAMVRWNGVQEDDVIVGAVWNRAFPPPNDTFRDNE